MKTWMQPCPTLLDSPMEKRNNDLSAYYSKLPYRLSHMKSALDYLLADRATGKLTLRKIIAKKEKGKTRRVSRARNKRQTTLSRMKYWAGNSWFCRITVIEQCKYMRRDTDMCGPRGEEPRTVEKRSSPSGTIHGEHVRNIHAFPRTHRRIAELYIHMYVAACVCIYTHIYACRVLWLCSCVYVHGHRSAVKPYAPVNVSLYVRYFCFVHRDTPWKWRSRLTHKDILHGLFTRC